LGSELTVSEAGPHPEAAPEASNPAAEAVSASAPSEADENVTPSPVQGAGEEE